LEHALLPVKHALVTTAEQLLSIQSTISHIPRREYATIEARARALRAARTEAIDRLDDIVSETEGQTLPEDWNDDVAAAKQLIVIPAVTVVDYRMCGSGGLNS
jgi:hypothetical protein